MSKSEIYHLTYRTLAAMAFAGHGHRSAGLRPARMSAEMRALLAAVDLGPEALRAHTQHLMPNIRQEHAVES